MTSVDSLRRQLVAMRVKIGRPDDPKQWCFFMEEDEQIPAHIQEQIAERDELYIKRYPKGYCGMNEASQRESEPSIGYVIERNGTVTCLYRSGKATQVRAK